MNYFVLKSSDETAMPPNTNALLQHTKRANYQAKIWPSALNTKIFPPSPDGFGWKVCDGDLHIEWLTGDHAPAAVLKTVKCKCRKQTAVVESVSAIQQV